MRDGTCVQLRCAMKTGLLWYDADPQAGLPEKVERAAQRYRQKLGRCPTVCYLHPAALDAAEPVVDCCLDGGTTAHVRLVAAAQVLPHHFWLGEEDTPATGRAAQKVDRPGEAAAPPFEGAAAAAERPQHAAARRRTEEGQLLQKAMAARSLARRHTTGGARR